MDEWFFSIPLQSSIDEGKDSYISEESLIKYYKEVDKYATLTEEQERQITTRIKSLFLSILDSLLNLEHDKLKVLQEEISIWKERDKSFLRKKEYLKRIKDILEELDSDSFIDLETKSICCEIKNKIKELEGLVKDLVRGNLRLVLFVVNRYVGYLRSSVSIEDLIQEGNLGLVEAAYRYDCDKTPKFISYAIWRIKKRVKEYLFVKCRGLKFPNKYDLLRNKVFRAYEEFYRENGYYPTMEELASYMNMLPSVILGVFQGLEDVIYTSEIINDGNKDIYVEDLLIDDNQTPEEQVLRNLFMEKFYQWLSKLSVREEFVIRLRLGFDGDGVLPLEEIGEKYLKISRERVRQIEKRGIEKLKNKFRV